MKSKPLAGPFADIPSSEADIKVTRDSIRAGQHLKLELLGTGLVLSGTNAQSGRTCLTLTSKNVAKPLVQWTPVATNAMNMDGNFTLVITNVVNRDEPQRFFTLKVQ